MAEEAPPHAASALSPGPAAALRGAIADAQTVLLLGDADPVFAAAAAASAAGRRLEHVDARGLLSLDFDRLVVGAPAAEGWRLGALSRALEEGQVFLLTHGESLLDDLRQRTVRMLQSRRIVLRGDRPGRDRVVAAAPAASLLLHVDDHRPLLLQWYRVIAGFTTRIRIDRDGPPPVDRR